MSVLTAYLLFGLPTLALAIAFGAIKLTQRSHRRYQDALSADLEEAARRRT